MFFVNMLNFIFMFINIALVEIVSGNWKNNYIHYATIKYLFIYLFLKISIFRIHSL